MILSKVSHVYVDRIHMAKHRLQRRTVLHAATNLWVPHKAEISRLVR